MAFCLAERPAALARGDKSQPRRRPRPARDDAVHAWLERALHRVAELERGCARRADGDEPALRVESAELVAIINRELAARSECAGLSVSAGRYLPAEGGGEALRAGLLVHVSGFVGPDAFRTLRDVVTLATERYRLGAAA